ncbi:hypothetical protein [Streptomyces hydrogenans]
MSTLTDPRAAAATPPTGLTATEAARRLAADGPDEVAARRPVRRYVPFLRTVLDTDPLRAAGLGPAAACGPAGFLAARAVRTAFGGTGPTGTAGPTELP